MANEDAATLASSSLQKLQQEYPFHIAVAVVVVVFTSVLLFVLAVRPGASLKSLKASPAAAAAGEAKQKKKKATKKFLTKERQRAKLREIVEITHDTKLFRFALPSDEYCLGLPCGKHIKIFCENPNANGNKTWNGKEDAETAAEIERKYTPTSSDLDTGVFDLVIKVYKPNERFANGGKVSQYLNGLHVGDELELSGPWGLIEYLGKGRFKKSSKEFQVSQVSMIAGGTGITPMLQIIEAILRDPQDETAVSLIFANQTEGDILVRSRLEELAEVHNGRFKVHFTLDRPPPGWKQSSGFVTREMISKQLFPPSENNVVLMCGPPVMITMALKPALSELGFPADRQLEF